MTEEINLNGEFNLSFAEAKPIKFELTNAEVNKREESGNETFFLTSFPQKSLLVQLSAEASREVADLSRVTYLINKFLNHQFCNIIEANALLFVKSVQSVKKLVKSTDQENLLNGSQDSKFAQAAQKLIEFDEKLRARIERKSLEEKSRLISNYDRMTDNNQFLSIKRKCIDETLLKAIRNLNNNEGIKVASRNTTAESSPSYHEINEDYPRAQTKPISILPLNINIFNNISDLNYGVKGILKLPSDNEALNPSKKQIAWDPVKISNEKIFLFSEEPILDEITQEEYTQIHLILSKYKEEMKAFQKDKA